MITTVIIAIGAFVAGLFVAWNNTKSSIKKVIDGDIAAAVGAAKDALVSLKNKL
jgi:hypothetical protein